MNNQHRLIIFLIAAAITLMVASSSAIAIEPPTPSAPESMNVPTTSSAPDSLDTIPQEFAENSNASSERIVESITAATIATPPSAEFYVRIYNIDDKEQVLADGSLIATRGYLQDSGYVKVGVNSGLNTNTIHNIWFRLYNGLSGYTWGYQIKMD